MARKKSQPWWEKPEKRTYHFEDEQLRNELRELLASLPPDHPAWVAYHEDRSCITIQRALNSESELHLQQAIMDCYNAWTARLWEIAKPNLTGR